MRILAATLCLLLAFAAQSQVNDGCMNGISTNPAAPVNPQTSSSYMNGPQYINSDFDWHETNGSNSLAPWSMHNMIYDNTNPFSGSSTFYISPFDPNGAPYASGYFSTNIADMDFYPEDGWELLYMNMGYNPDGSSTNSGVSRAPYVILYNKFRSIIRVFGKTDEINYTTNPIKAVMVKFSFRSQDPTGSGSTSQLHDQVSGLFSGQNEFITALDQKTSVYQVVSLVNHPNTVNQWFHADFHVNYDPCECYFKSELKLSLNFISTQEIDLKARAVSIAQPISETGNVDYGKNFLTNIPLDGDDANTAGAYGGSIIYKSMDAMLDDYIAKLTSLEAYNNNKAIKRAKTIFQVYKALRESATNWLGGQLADQVIKYVPDIIEDIQSAAGTSFNVKISKKDTEEEAKKQLGNVAKSLDALIASKMGITDPPPTPTMPMATFTEMHFAGTITTNSPVSLPSLINPGTYNSNTVASGEYGTTEALSILRYPVYNEALGTFALLETPKLQRFEKTDITRTYVSGATGNINDPFNPNTCQTSIEYSSSVKYRNSFKPAGPLKFYFNPATNINWSKSSVKFQIIFKGLTGVEGQPSSYSVLNLNPYSFDNENKSSASPMLSADCIQDLVMSLESPIGLNEHQYISVEHPCSSPFGSYQSYFNNYDFSVIADGANDHLQQYGLLFGGVTEKAYIKLTIDAEYYSVDHNGFPNKNTIVQTFEMPIENVSTDPAQTVPFDLTGVPTVETIPTTNYIQNGNYNPLEMLSVIGNLTSAGNLNHNLFAQNEVNIQGEASIVPSNNASFNLQINQVYACSGSALPVSSSDVYQFCHSPSYKANKATNPFNSRVTGNNVNPKNNYVPEIDLNASMNGNNILVLTSKNANDEKRNFRLIDMQGRVLIEENHLPLEIILSDYISGIYLIEYQTEKGIVRKKIVKAN